MAADKIIKDILDHIDRSINDFSKTIPGIQEDVAKELLDQIKQLETSQGRVLNSVQNLKLIGQIKARLERLIVSNGYKESVKQFITAFDLVESLQNSYFSLFNAQYKPSRTLPIIKSLAIDSTINGLIGQGLGSAVVDKIGEMLTSSTTTGGSYASLTQQLVNSVKGTSEQEGLLARHSRTITTDAINQYAAQYQSTVAADLGLNWLRYVGSNITTTREFCERLTAKEWVHKSELPTVIHGKIDGVQCKLGKQGLPLGMIPGTDASNFQVRRGGYNCGHQAFWVPDSAVPDDVKRQLIEPKETSKQQVDLKVIKEGNLGPYLNSTQVQKTIKGKFPELSKEEKTAIWAYTDNEYYFINRFLRGKWEPKNREYFSNYAKLLSNALESSKNKHQGWVFRGMRAEKEDLVKYYEAHKSGKAVVHEEFTSTSHMIGAEFGGNVKFSIYSKRGVNIEGLSLHGQAEKEVLFNSGSSFKVISIREVDGTTYIKMEEI